MTVSERKVSFEILGRRHEATRYDMFLDWSDYDKIFFYLRWKTPVRYEPYGSVMQGIVATYADGSTERMSWCQLRDLIDSHWYHLKKILSEEGQDLDVYTARERGVVSRFYSGMRGETMTLDCDKMSFRTHTCGSCPFSRIWGTVYC